MTSKKRFAAALGSLVLSLLALSMLAPAPTAAAPEIENPDPKPCDPGWYPWCSGYTQGCTTCGALVHGETGQILWYLCIENSNGNLAKCKAGLDNCDHRGSCIWA